MSTLTLYQFEYRLALALALGAILGLERQFHSKAAGTRTHALVAVGSALFVLLAEGMPGDASATGRVVGQIITGIGFLGAGAILRSDNTTITGLTTAATVWCAGAIGTLAGLGSWYQAVVGTGFILMANVLLKPLDLLINRLRMLRGPDPRFPAPPPTPIAPTGLRYRLRVAVRPDDAGAHPALPQVLEIFLKYLPLALIIEPLTVPHIPLWVCADLRLPNGALVPLLATLQARSDVTEVSSEAVPTG